MSLRQTSPSYFSRLPPLPPAPSPRLNQSSPSPSYFSRLPPLPPAPSPSQKQFLSRTPPPEILFQMALNMNLGTLSRFCRGSTEFNSICMNPEFWREKARRDFPATLYTHGRKNKTEILPDTAEKYHKLFLAHNCEPGLTFYPPDCLAKAILKADLNKFMYFLDNKSEMSLEKVVEAIYSRDSSSTRFYSPLTILNLIHKDSMTSLHTLNEISEGLGKVGDLDTFNEFIKHKNTNDRTYFNFLSGLIRGDEFSKLKRRRIDQLKGSKLDPDRLEKIRNIELDLDIEQNKLKTSRVDKIKFALNKVSGSLNPMQISILYFESTQSGNLELVKAISVLKTDRKVYLDSFLLALSLEYYDIGDFLLENTILPVYDDSVKLYLSREATFKPGVMRIVRYLRNKKLFNLPIAIIGAAEAGKLQQFQELILMEPMGPNYDELFIKAATRARTLIMEYILSFNEISQETIDKAFREMIAHLKELSERGRGIDRDIMRRYRQAFKLFISSGLSYEIIYELLYETVYLADFWFTGQFFELVTTDPESNQESTPELLARIEDFWTTVLNDLLSMRIVVAMARRVDSSYINDLLSYAREKYPGFINYADAINAVNTFPPSRKRDDLLKLLNKFQKSELPSELE